MKRMKTIALILLLIAGFPAAYAAVVNLAGAWLMDTAETNDSHMVMRNGILGSVEVAGHDQVALEAVNQSGAKSFVGVNEPTVTLSDKAAAEEWRMYE